MKRLLIIFICLHSLTQAGYLKSAGAWRSYLSYHNTTLVAEGNNHVFAVANGSLYSYNKEDKSIAYYAKETNPALSDNNILNIRFSSDENVLIITYLNGNIDLLGDDGITNLPFLMENNSIQNKEVNSIYTNKNTAYLAAKFGIVVINLQQKEIKETYRLNTSVSSVVIKDDYIYAAAGKKVLKALLNANLIDPNNWKPDYTIQAEDTIRQLAVFKNTLCFLIKGKGIYYQSENNTKTLLTNHSLTGMKVENDLLLTHSANELFIYSSLTEREKGSFSDIKDVSSTKNNKKYWLATGEKGITGIERTNANQYQIILSDINNNSPVRNYADFLTIYNNKLYVAGGGRWTDRKQWTGTVMIYDTQEQIWNNIPHINNFKDATGIAVDKNDESHLFVSSWGEGVYEIKENELVKIYNEKNSALQSALPTNGYTRVEGLCFDNNNNLWMTNSSVSDVIKVLKPDGSWVSIPIPGVANAALADKILITANGDKWINLVRADRSGILVFNERNSLDNNSDHDFYYFSTLNDRNGNIGASEFFCITEDKSSTLWIGTNRGPIILYNASNALNNKEQTNFNRIIYTDENGENQFFLKDERVKAIAVDGGNRKWLGTESDGLYLVSEDGSEVIEHFRAENSPLLSNKIESLAINNKTGEIFIGTDKGLISYLGDATEGSKSYSDVYAYPNPVRPEFNQKVIITGLMENSNVKITDVKGNLIYQTKSVGGQVTWDCRNKSSKYVASGIYLVIAATPEAKESVVTKIAVVQ
ncbi:MAG: T9SS type A sorting domain-containing protein [Tannerellaceae bacterium]|jgi:ligand-binding sensor domain-containing protein|nr:T9SS type A sorting domain-containing protein [Tannerellaceae bacterium]